MSAEPRRAPIRFPRISAKAFQHYDDMKATRALQRLPVFAAVLKYTSEKLIEKAARLHHLSHCIRLGPEQGAELHRRFVSAAETLCIDLLPELYISTDNSINAYAMGMKQATIVMTRGIVQCMTPQEILAVMGHELGHVKCEHMVNKTIASLIAEFGVGALAEQIPVFGPAAMLVLQAHLMDWSRKAELSCDRAALLVVQDPPVVASVLAKLGGWPASLGQINLQALVDQAHEYESSDNESVAAALKLIRQMESAIYLTHPLPIHRVESILRWSESDQYRAILAGNYPQTDTGTIALRHSCGSEIQPGDTFCPACGDRIEAISRPGRSCAACGTAIRTGAPAFHCTECGSDLRKPGAVLER